MTLRRRQSKRRQSKRRQSKRRQSKRRQSKRRQRKKIKGPNLWIAGNKYQKKYLETWLQKPTPVRGVIWGTMRKGTFQHPSLSSGEAKAISAILVDFKDPKIKKHIAGSSIYFDDTDLVVGSDTVMTLSSKGNGRRETVADMKKAILKSPARVDPNKPAAPGEKKFGRFNVKLPTEMQGAYGGDAVKIENPRAIIKTDLDSAKEIQRTIKAKGVKFRMMKRKDHVAVYIDADDGGLLDAALKKIKRIK